MNTPDAGFRVVVPAALLLLIAAGLPAAELSGFPFQDETLRYRVSWPSGIGLGEARLSARRIDGGRWEFELTLDASAAGVTIRTATGRSPRPIYAP